MRFMKAFRFALATAAFTIMAVTAATPARAQISIRIGPAPACPYGYFDYAPYNCAPYGYYGPQWFNSGLFIGAGPWFHGPRGFHGYVNHQYDPHFGYRGGFPQRGERAFAHGEDRSYRSFHGNAYRDGHGHESRGDDHGHDGGHGH
jgi:hypothetical protein